MKLSLHQKSKSAKNLSLNSKSEYFMQPTCDPFENMKLVKKNVPILRPICHKRVISEDFSVKLHINESNKIIENSCNDKVQNILSPRFSAKSFLCLNPNFKKNDLKRFRKIPELNTPRVIRNKHEELNMMTYRQNCGTLANLHKRHFDKNRMVFRCEKNLKKQDLEFSFGK